MNHPESAKEELKRISPFLTEIKTKATTETSPEGYLESLESKIYERLKAEGFARKQPSSALKLNLSPFQQLSAIAATLIFLVAAVWFIQTGSPFGPNKNHTAELTGAEIEDFVVENIHQFEPDLLVDMPASEIYPESEKSAPGGIRNSDTEFPPEDLDGLLQDMSDQELEQLL
jgi:hypothetical protein